MNRAALFWNSLTGTVLYAIGGASSFIMAPFLVHHLTNGGYGFWELLMGLAGYLGILDLGVSPAVLRYVAMARGEGNHARLVQVINTGFKTFLMAGSVGAVMMLVVAIHPSMVFGSLPFPISEGRLLIALGATIFLISFVRTTFTAALLGLQMHRAINGIRAILTIAQAVTVYLLLSHDNSHALAKLASVTMCSALIETAICSLMLWRMVGGGLSPRKAHWRDTKELFHFGLKSVGIMAAGSLMRQGMLFVIAHAAGPAAVTFYVLSSRIIDYGQALVAAVGYPITPYLASTFGKDGIEGVTSVWDFTTRAMHFIQAGIAMGVFWLGMPFLAVWMGAEYAQRGAPVFNVLIAGMMLQTFGVNSGRMLVSLNRHGRIAIGSSLFAVASFVAALLTVPHFGLPAAAACMMAFLVTLNIWELWLVSKALKFSFVKHLGETVCQTGPPVVAGSIAMWLLQTNWLASSYARIVVHALVGGTVYLVVSMVTIVNDEERNQLWSRTRTFLTRRGVLRTAA